MEKVTINTIIELPELTQDWEIDSWRAQKEPCVHQDPGEKQWPQKKLTQTYPGVSGNVQESPAEAWWVVACFRIGGTECSSTCMGSFEEGHQYLHYFHHSLNQSEFAQSCPILCDFMDYSLPGFYIHGIFQARILEWVIITFSSRSSRARDWTWVSCIVGTRFTIWTTRGVPTIDSVESSHVSLFVTPWTAAGQASLSSTNSQSLPKLMSIESVTTSNHLILCLSFLFLPSIFLSIRVFSNESTLHVRWPKYSSFSFNIRPSKEHSGLISFRMEWLDLLAIQGTVKSLRQHHSSKASILWCSAFFIVQISHSYITTGKTIALTRQNFVVKVMTLVFNMLSRLVIIFLPMSKCLRISWLIRNLQWFWGPPK